MGHFARECRAPRNKEGQFRNQDNTRKHGNNEDTSSKAMLAIDGVGFDWSDMAEEQVQTNMALMAFSDSEVYNDKTCSKTCLKNYETLKKQCDDLIVKLNQTEFTAATYKRGLATVEEQLITYRKNEVLFSEEVAVLKREVACKDYEINVLKSEFEKVKQEKEGIEFKIEKFDKASKDLDKLLGSQITDKSKKGLGYNVVPPPHPLIYNRPKKLDLSYSGLDEFKEPEFKSYGSEDISEDISSFVESLLNVDKETIFLDKKIEIVKPKNHENPVKKSVRVNYNYTTNRTHPNAQRNMVPRAVLMKTGLKSFNTARTVNTAHPKSTVYSAKPMSFNTGKVKVNTVRQKVVKTARPNSAVVNAVRGKPQQDDTGFIDNGCSRHMTGNIAYLSDFKEFDGDKPEVELENIIKSYTIPPTPNTRIHKDHPITNVIRDVKFTIQTRRMTKSTSEQRLNPQTLLKLYLIHLGGSNAGRTSTVQAPTGKQHRASCKSKVLNPITKPLFMLHMDLFGPTFDETSEILKNFIKEIENLVDKKVKIIRCDNVTEFKNKVMDAFCREKDIRREYSIARTPQQNGNRVLVVKPHNKTPYELFRGFKPALSFMRPFGCHVTILNTLDNLGKFDGKSDEGFFVGYSLSSKAFRVYNTRTRRVEENLHIRFLENKPIIEGNGTQGELNASTSTQKEEISQDCIVMPIWKDASYFDSPSKDVDKSDDDSSPKEVNTTGQHVNTDSPEVNTGRFKLNTVDPSVNTASSYDPDSPKDMFKIGASHTLEADQFEVSVIKGGNAGRTSAIQTLTGIKKGWLHKLQQEEGIDYEEVFAPVARIEAIRLFLAYASFMGFLVYQMDVKSAFLYGTIKEEVYVTQPPGFKDLNHPNKVYKVVKALYGLYQAQRAWYETLANYLLGNGFKRGKIDQTLFIKKQKGDILLVQVYVDDIIFGSTNKELCTAFEKLMKDNQDKFIAEILKKFNYIDVMFAFTPVDLEKPLIKDGDADDVEVNLYRLMIWSLMYLIASRPDIMFVVFAYTDSDYTEATQDRKSTTGGCQFLGNRLISWQCKKQTMVATSIIEAEYVAIASCCGQVSDDVVHKELGDRMEKATTTASSLEAKQDSDNINRTQSMATLNEPNP
ncbi:retrovirus-related pol polyprotein from transposon TNT 1-94 [Tanacetum coccineum]